MFNTFQHGGRKTQNGRHRWWKKIHVLNAILAWMQCRMSQKEFLMPNYHASNVQQAGRKFSIPSQRRSKTLQLNIKMMNMNKASRRKRSTRRRTETYSSGPAVIESQRSCMEDNTIEKNGLQNSCFRGILLRLSS